MFDLLPLVHVAWADGKIQQGESAMILNLLRVRGVSGGKAFTVLYSLLEKRPSQEYLDESLEVLKGFSRTSRAKPRPSWVCASSSPKRPEASFRSSTRSPMKSAPSSTRSARRWATRRSRSTPRGSRSSSRLTSFAAPALAGSAVSRSMNPTVAPRFRWTLSKGSGTIGQIAAGKRRGLANSRRTRELPSVGATIGAQSEAIATEETPELGGRVSQKLWNDRRVGSTCQACWLDTCTPDGPTCLRAVALSVGSSCGRRRNSTRFSNMRWRGRS